MIVVAIASDPTATGDPSGRLAETIAGRAAAAGSTVQYVARIPADEHGDRLVLRLGRRGVGNAAVLRDAPGSAAPGLEAADLELALRYLAGFRVLVIVGPTSPDLLRIAGEASRFSGASVVLATVGSSPEQDSVPAGATVIEAGRADGESGSASVVAAYAVALDAGAGPPAAWRDATGRLAVEAAQEER